MAEKTRYQLIEELNKIGEFRMTESWDDIAIAGTIRKLMYVQNKRCQELDAIIKGEREATDEYKEKVDGN